AARWRELAVRIALGASSGNTLWTGMRPCGVILSAGGLVGVLGALAAGGGMPAQGVGGAPGGLFTFTFAPAVLGIVGVLAAMLAAVRVLRADAAATLRSQ